jgi:hypothetical protein
MGRGLRRGGGVRGLLSGYNNDVRFRGQVFHVQTEDGGIKNPFVRTQIFLQGSIVSMIQESYEPLLAIRNLEAVVRKMMQEQHKDLIRRMVRGEFNAQVERILGRPLLPPEAAAEEAATGLAGTEAPAAGEELTLDELILRAMRGRGKPDLP